MAKYLTIIITIIIVMFFISGCQEQETKPVKIKKTQPVTVQPTEAEPNDISVQAPKTKPPLKTKSLSTAELYKKYAEFLSTFVNDKGMVNYNSLKRKRSNVEDILDGYANFDPKQYNNMTKEEKIAFWINVYNINMLNNITKNYPIESTRIMRLIWPLTSVRHIKGLWDIKFIIMDEEFTLNEIDQRFFGKEFDEPRVFLALTYASRSSPALRNEPYYGEKLYQQLEEQAKKFLSSENAFYIDRDKNFVALSAILQPSWHGKYFTGKYGTVKKFKSYEPTQRALLNFVSNYISERDVDYLELESYEIKFIKYDWRLNDNSETN